MIGTFLIFKISSLLVLRENHEIKLSLYNTLGHLLNIRYKNEGGSIL